MKPRPLLARLSICSVVMLVAERLEVGSMDRTVPVTSTTSVTAPRAILGLWVIWEPSRTSTVALVVVNPARVVVTV